MTFSLIRRQRRATGFTLIELLVVISIIALLVGILLPALSAARKSAQQAQCMSNQRQFGLAHSMYNAEHKGMFVTWEGPAADYYNWNWAYEFFHANYLPSPAVYQCPTLVDWVEYNYSIGVNDVTRHPTAPTPYYYIGYGYNYLHVGSAYAANGRNLAYIYTPTKVADFANPVETIMLADSWNGGYNGAVLLSYCIIADNYSGSLRINDRHFEGANILWMDGHCAQWPNAMVTLQDGLKTYFDNQ